MKKLILFIVVTLMIFVYSISYSLKQAKKHDSILSSRFDIKEIYEQWDKPNQSARPRCWYHLLGNNITAEGITKDFEAMHRIGIGGVTVFIGGLVKNNPEITEFEQIRCFLQHIGNEASMLKIDLEFHNGPGWSGSGGPWISVEENMKEIVFSEVIAIPGQIIELPICPPNEVAYKDIVTLAIPYNAENSFKFSPGVKGFFNKSNEKIIQTSILPVVSDPLRIVDITNKSYWESSKDTFRIVRIGHAATGRKVNPTPAIFAGYNSDPLDSTAFKKHFDSYIAKVLKDFGSSAVGITVDSWEMGVMNWGNNLINFFSKQHGYDLIPWLSVLTGQLVVNEEMSLRFLWDFRQTLAKMLQKNYYKHIASLAHFNGLQFVAEGYCNHYPSPLDHLTCNGLADIPMTEFWGDGSYNADPLYIKDHPLHREVISAAHLWDRSIIQAESFTVGYNKPLWDWHPGEMKSIGDAMLSAGVNRFVIHSYVHQPWEYKPGITLGKFGLAFNRHAHWFDMARGWIDYLTRVQTLFQSGHITTDFLVFTGEDIPLPRPQIDDTNLYGYKWDYVNSDALLHQLKVKNGRLTTPQGNSYSLLVLGNQLYMTPKVLSKIKKLIQEGAKILVGSPPLSSPSLSNYPECDNELSELVKSIWNNSDPTEDSLGNGQIFIDEFISNVLNQLNEKPHILIKNCEVPEEIGWNRKYFKNGEIYFVANLSDKPIKCVGSFNFCGGNTQIWDPITGKRFNAIVSEQNNRTELEFYLKKGSSYFVINQQDNSLPIPNKSFNSKVLQNVLNLNGPWEVKLNHPEENITYIVLDTLSSLSDSKNFNIQEFTGIAEYTTEFNITNDLEQSDLILSLGKVVGLSEVFINNQFVGIVWTDPWEIDISSIINIGLNKLTVRVATTWTNGLIGDLVKDGPFKSPFQYDNPELQKTNKRFSVSNQIIDANASFRPCGLIGPVEIFKNN